MNELLEKFYEIKKNINLLYKPFIQPDKIPFNNEIFKYKTHFKNGFEFNKKNFNFVNNQDKKIFFTIFEINNKDKNNKRCLLYLHSHASNRTEGYFLLNFCGQLNLSLCLIDFSYFGESEGEYSSLGINESKDTNILVNLLLNNFKFSSLIIWGRSMGAVAALKACTKIDERKIELLILDSPFYKIKNFFKNVVKNLVYVPDFILNRLYETAKKQIKERININIDKINSKNYATQIKIPTIYIASNCDEYIEFKKSKDIYDSLLTLKKIFKTIDLKHSEDRNNEIIKSIFSIIRKVLENKITYTKNKKFSFLINVDNNSKRKLHYDTSPFKVTFNNRKKKKKTTNIVFSEKNLNIDFNTKYDSKSKFSYNSNMKRNISFNKFRF